MPIFNHTLLFEDEPLLQEVHIDRQKNMICISEKSAYSLLEKFPLLSDWYLMSGQQVRYYSKVPFEEADQIFSWSLEIQDVLTLIWDAENRKINYIKGKYYTPERLRFWVYHTFFPLVLELQRMYRILHVGAVEIKGKPVLFSAFSFGGKSTLTDYFIKKGHRMLSDDSIAIDKRGDKYYAIASYPFHRPYREPETLGYTVKNFATEPKPLHAVYLLEKSEPNAEVKIVELKGIEKFKAFHYSTFIDFTFMKKERFDFFTEMAKHIPVYQVSIPWDLKKLEEVYQAIIDMQA
jgi:hypothetical protein